MQTSNTLSRRSFLQSRQLDFRGGVSAPRRTGTWPPSRQAACSAKQEAAAFRVLAAAEATDFAAIAARIIPTTDTPGATEAGVIYFFDNAFADAMRGQLDAARAGLAEFNAALLAADHSGSFADLACGCAGRIPARAGTQRLL